MGAYGPVRLRRKSAIGNHRYGDFASRFRNRGQGARRRSMSKSFLAAAAERTAEAESDLAELQRGTWATDRVG